MRAGSRGLALPRRWRWVFLKERSPGSSTRLYRSVQRSGRLTAIFPWWGCTTLSLPQVAWRRNASFDEGHPKWRTLPRASATLVQTAASVRPDTGQLNPGCSVMPILIFTDDHRVETTDRVVAAVREYAGRHDSEDIRFRLATGNLAIMVATNDLRLRHPGHDAVMGLLRGHHPVFTGNSFGTWSAVLGAPARLCTCLRLDGGDGDRAQAVYPSGRRLRGGDWGRPRNLHFQPDAPRSAPWRLTCPSLS